MFSCRNVFEYIWISDTGPFEFKPILIRIACVCHIFRHCEKYLGIGKFGVILIKISLFSTRAYLRYRVKRRHMVTQAETQGAPTSFEFLLLFEE